MEDIDSEWTCMFENMCDKPIRGDTMHLVDRSHFFCGATSVNLQNIRNDVPISNTVHKAKWTILEGINTLSHWCDPTIIRCYVLLRPVADLTQSDFSPRARIPPVKLLGWRLLVHTARFKHALEHDAHTMRGLRHFTSVMITLHHKHNKAYVEIDAYVNTTIFNDPPRLPELNIPLRPAQEQSLKWMQIMEDGILDAQNFISTPRWFPLGGNTDYVCLLDEEVLVSTDTLQQFSTLALVDTVTYHGGILADRPGAGKTAIVLALIAATIREDTRTRSAMDKVTSLPIKASLVIVPMNLVAQWQAEVLKFMPTSFKCVTIINKRQYASTTMGDIQDADMVLTTIEFLTGRAYSREAKNGEFYTLCNHRRKARHEADIVLRGFWWRRLVFDEQHVIPHVTSNGWKHIKSIRASVYWGVTATPCPARINDVLRVRPDDLGKLDSGVLFTNTIRRTPIPPHLPPVETEYHYVPITSRERDILDMHRHEGLPQLIQLCTCFNVLALLGNNEDVNARVCMTFDELSRVMVTRRTAEVAAVEPEVETISRLIASDTRVLAHWGASQEEEEEEKEEQEQEQKDGNEEEEDGFVRLVRRRLKVSKRRHAALQAHISRLRGQSAFFQRQVELSEEERVCPICITTTSDVMTTCGHWFCKACTRSYRASSSSSRTLSTPCPLCKVALGPRDWVEVMGSGAETTPANVDAPAHEYGSKLRAIVELVRRLQGIGEKAIMFVQWSELSRTLRAILFAGGVKVVSMTGNTAARNVAVERIKKGNADLLILSMDVSTTGLDLTMANHVIFAHALVGGSPSTQERRVSQAVSRVHRFGQTRNVFVHWFIAEDTCEHELFRTNNLL